MNYKSIFSPQLCLYMMNYVCLRQGWNILSAITETKSFGTDMVIGKGKKSLKFISEFVFSFSIFSFDIKQLFKNVVVWIGPSPLLSNITINGSLNNILHTFLHKYYFVCRWHDHCYSLPAALDSLSTFPGFWSILIF